MKIAKEQGLDKDARLTTPGDFYFNNLTAFVENKVCFYECSKCTKPYFGGIIDCEQEMGIENTTKREDLMCQTCLIKETSYGSNICNKGHGSEYIDWKCMYCCSVAEFNCSGGSQWYCDRCHRSHFNKKLHDCKGINCPLGVPHPSPGYDFKESAFPLGCSLCRAEIPKFHRMIN